MRIAGKTALVTGGSAGIGREIARQLQSKGAQVIVTGRDSNRLEAMEREGFEAIAADLSSAAGVDALIEAVRGRAIALLINNAGQGVEHDFRPRFTGASVDVDAADRCIYTNLNAPIRLIAGLMDDLRKRDEAAIVNVTSGLAIAPRAGSPVYCATKAALRSYSQALRAQLKSTNIRVIEALPPVVDTQMTADRTNRKMPPGECARQIIAAIESNRDEANVGMVKLLQAVHSLSPALARRVMLRF